jgi:hypothetical protein
MLEAGMLYKLKYKRNELQIIRPFLDIYFIFHLVSAYYAVNGKTTENRFGLTISKEQSHCEAKSSSYNHEISIILQNPSLMTVFARANHFFNKMELTYGTLSSFMKTFITFSFHLRVGLPIYFFLLGFPI